MKQYEARKLDMLAVASNLVYEHVSGINDSS